MKTDLELQVQAIEDDQKAMLHTVSRIEGTVKGMETQMALTVRALQVIAEGLGIREKLEEIAADLDELSQARRSDFPMENVGEG
jgi:hypothetical protein